MSKKVSIITTTFRDLPHLKETVSEVLKQDYDNIEYIIIDGGSNDGTLEYLQSLEPEIRAREGWTYQYVSEPDQGIYDAINKGIQKATGDIVGTMFDKFTSKDVVRRMVEAIESEDADGVHGDLLYVDEDGKPVRTWVMGNDRTIRQGWLVAHPTMYLKREIYEQYGLYRMDMKIAADYEFMVRIFKDQAVKMAYIPDVLVTMFYGGTSNQGLGSYYQSFVESYKGLKINHVKGAFLICVKRTFGVFFQFAKAKRMK